MDCREMPKVLAYGSDLAPVRHVASRRAAPRRRAKSFSESRRGPALIVDQEDVLISRRRHAGHEVNGGY